MGGGTKNISQCCCDNNQPSTLDRKVGVTADDNYPSYLIDKIVSSDGLVTFTVVDPANDEKFDLSIDQSKIDHSKINLDDGTNPHGTTKSDVGLPNVVDGAALTSVIAGANITIDNSDPQNPIITAVQLTNHSELNLDDGTNPHGTTQDDVGLGNVDNTSDLDKPISNDTQTALNGKLNSVTAGTNFSIDYTDPLNPIISSTGGGVDTDELVKVSNNDTTAAYLISKLISTNSSISLLIENPSGSERIDVNLVEPPNDGGIYYRNGNTQAWVKANGLKESFDLYNKENNQNANNGQFHGCFKILPEGTYNSFITIFNDLNLGGSQSFELRCALYDLSGNLLTQGNVLLNNANQDDRQDVILDTELNLQTNTAVYMVCGVNDNIGGGAVQIFRINSNATNDANFAFSFNQSTGSLPNNLPTVSATNNVRYQLYYGQ